MLKEPVGHYSACLCWLRCSGTQEGRGQMEVEVAETSGWWRVPASPYPPLSLGVTQHCSNGTRWRKTPLDYPEWSSGLTHCHVGTARKLTCHQRRKKMGPMKQSLQWKRDQRLPADMLTYILFWVLFFKETQCTINRGQNWLQCAVLHIKFYISISWH